MVQSVIVDSCIDDSCECIGTQNALIVSLKSNQDVGCDYRKVTHSFERHSEDTDADHNVHMLVMKFTT